jgi:hypothetical protein
MLISCSQLWTTDGLWTLEHHRLFEDVIPALREISTEMTCPEFCGNIKNNHTFLHKVVCNENMNGFRT